MKDRSKQWLPGQTKLSETDRTKQRAEAPSPEERKGGKEIRVQFRGNDPPLGWGSSQKL